MARAFNGSSDFIDLGTHAALTSSLTAMTFSAWINPSGFPNAFNSIIAAFNVNYEFYVQSNGTLYLAIGGQPGIIGATVLVVGNWYNVAFTTDFASTASTYINGVFEQSGSAVNTNALHDCTIGKDPQTAGRFFAGSIADVTVWSVVLSAAELAALGKGARPIQIRPKSLVTWLPLGGIQSPEPDISGSAFNGTLTGTAPDFGPPFLQFTPRWNQFLTPPAGVTVFPYPPFQLKAA